MRLALALGRTVEELEATMPVDEFEDWIAFYAEEPFGEVRADLRAGIVANTFARVMSGKGSRKTTPLDFMPIVRAANERAKLESGRDGAITEMRQMFEGNLSVAVRRVTIARRDHGVRRAG